MYPADFTVVHSKSVRVAVDVYSESFQHSRALLDASRKTHCVLSSFCLHRRLVLFLHFHMEKKIEINSLFLQSNLHFWRKVLDHYVIWDLTNPPQEACQITIVLDPFFSTKFIITIFHINFYCVKLRENEVQRRNICQSYNAHFFRNTIDVDSQMEVESDTSPLDRGSHVKHGVNKTHHIQIFI